VVGANEGVVRDPTHRDLRAAVWTEVFESADTPSRAEEDNLLAKKLDTDRRIGHVERFGHWMPVPAERREVDVAIGDDR
jgi:hypothetical protein